MVAYHKLSTDIKDSIFTPIHVGKAVSLQNLDMIGDNTGDNISRKNPIYCEMTAMYWAWKNLKDCDYIGLCHYRRIMTFKRDTVIRTIGKRILIVFNRIKNVFIPGTNYIMIPCVKTKSESEFKQYASEFSSSLNKMLSNNDFDCIVPKPIRFSSINVRQFFDIGLEPRVMMDSIVKELNPDFYNYYLMSQKSDKLYGGNIFIMRRELFYDYCSTIFPILEEHEKRTIETGWCTDILKDKSYSRRSGYFAEFLTSAYIQKLLCENKKILYTNLVYYDA